MSMSVLDLAVYDTDMNLMTFTVNTVAILSLMSTAVAMTSVAVAMMSVVVAMASTAVAMTSMSLMLNAILKAKVKVIVNFKKLLSFWPGLL